MAHRVQSTVVGFLVVALHEEVVAQLAVDVGQVGVGVSGDLVVPNITGQL